MPRVSSEFIRLSCLYAAIFIVNGIQLPYWPVWLESRGMGPEEIGILSGALYWAKAVTNPTIGTIIDTRRNHLMMMRLLGVSSLLISLFYLGVDGFWALLVIGLLGGSLFSGITPVAEVISMDHASKGRLDYARVRLWGSISFMAIAYILGEVLKGSFLGFVPEPEIILWFFLGGLLITVASTWFAPHFEQTSLPQNAVQPQHREPWSGLLKDRNFLIFLVFSAAIQGSHAVYYAFGTLNWKSQGLGEDVIGMFWAIGVLAEIILFAFSARLFSKANPSVMMIAAAVAGLIRWPLMIVTTNIFAVALLQTLHAFTFGAAHLAAMHYITANTHPGLVARAQTVYSAVAIGLGSGLLMIVAGHLYKDFAGWAYLAMAGLAGVALVSSLELYRSSSLRRPTEAVNEAT